MEDQHPQQKQSKTQEKIPKAREMFKEAWRRTKSDMKPSKKPEKPEAFLWGVALALAIVSDAMDMIPVVYLPIVDLVLGAPLKISVYVIIIKQIGIVRSVSFPRHVALFLAQTADPILSQVPIAEWFSPITTITVCYAWWYSKRSYKKLFINKQFDPLKKAK